MVKSLSPSEQEQIKNEILATLPVTPTLLSPASVDKIILAIRNILDHYLLETENIEACLKKIALKGTRNETKYDLAKRINGKAVTQCLASSLDLKKDLQKIF